MPSQQSLKWLTTFLATVATVSALPQHQKRALGDWVTATIDGQVVSWQNDYSGAPATTAPASAAPTIAAPATTTVAPAPAPPAQTGGGAVWVYATIDGQAVSWVNNWPPPAQNTDAPSPAPTTSTTAAPAPQPTTTAASAPPPSTTAAPASADYVYATINGVLVSWINNWPPPAATNAPAPTTTAAPTPTTTTVAPPPAGPTNAASCKDVHIFLAKGNNEPYPGRQGTLVNAICNGLSSCDYEDILYENTLGIDYCVGVTEGSNNGVNQITTYAQTCPLSKLVLSGYSQGTDIIGNILGGGGSVFGVQKCVEGYNPALNPYTSPGNQIGAALFFGNTRHTADQSYNYLNGSGYSSDNARSLYPDSLTNMNKFSNVIRDYCDSTDPVCATLGPGPFVIANHLNYFDRYSNDAAAWVKAKLGY